MYEERSIVPRTAATPPFSPTSTTAPDRRQRRSFEIRERLFRAALTLFTRKGFVETTVEDITNAADVGKGTFFNHFPSKDHILIAFGDLQLSKLQAAVDDMRQSPEPMPVFLRALTDRMTQEPARSPGMVRVILQANLSSSPVRNAMRERHARAEALLTQLMEIGQERGEVRSDLPALELARVFRQASFGTLLLWSVFGDASLPDRMNTAMNVIWSGMAARDPVTAASPQT
jgi:AcrR family transcriptional regulator